MNPTVQPFFHEATNTWSYVVSAPGGAAALIDPVLDYEPKAARTSTTAAEGLLAHVRAHRLQVQWILETHAHADHLSAGQWLKQQHLPGAKVAIGRGIVTVQHTFAKLFNLGEAFASDGSQFDHLFEAGECFSIGDIEGRVIPVPGHTSDSNAYLIGDALFTGDSLFMPDAGTARCDFPGGDAAALYHSIQRLFDLPGPTRVFVCHDYGPGGRAFACETSIAEQRRANIHVHDGTTEAQFVEMRQSRDASLEMPTLILPSVQVNIRGGALPDADENGVRYLRIPLDQL